MSSISGGSGSGSNGDASDSDYMVPLVGVVVSILSFGTFAVPMKLPTVVAANCPPIIFQLYMSVGIMLSSWIVLAWEPFAFTWWGLPATIVWTAGSTISVQVISDIGMSIGQGVWSGWVALTSFLWGAFGHRFFSVFTTVTMRSLPGAAFGMGLLLLGIALIASVGGAASKMESKEEQADVYERQRLLGQDAQGFTHGTINDSTAAGQIARPVDGVGGNRAIFIRGLLLAVLVGLCGGSTLVPIKFSPVHPFQSGTASAIFAVSFGICIVPVTICFAVLLSLGAVLSGRSIPELHLSTCFLPGVVSGMLWNAGNIASIYAVQPPLGFAVGYPITQCCTLVAGLLGILVYGEIQGWKLISAWIISACVLLSGAGLLGYFGSSAN